MKLKSYQQLLTVSKEAVDATLAPVRANSAHKKAELKIAELEESVTNLQQKLDEACSTKDINYDRIIELIDDQAIAERRIEQLQEIINQLFPAKK